VVENMSWLDLPDGTRMELFGAGGGQSVADSLAATTGTRVPLLGQVPIDQQVREGGDAGAPVVLTDPGSPAATAYREIAETLAARQRSLVGRALGLAQPAASARSELAGHAAGMQSAYSRPCWLDPHR